MRYELDLEHVSGNADGDNDEAELEKLDHKWWKIE